MLEKDFNRIWNRMFREVGFSYKIPDPQKNASGGVSSTKRPFDIFSCAFGRNFYVENKLIKKDFSAFNFNKIEEHQWDALTDINKDNKDNITVFGISYWVYRKLFSFMVLDFELVEYLKLNGKKSILGKEVKILSENNLLIPIKKEAFNPELILEKIVTIEVWKSIFGE